MVHIQINLALQLEIFKRLQIKFLEKKLID